MHTLPQCPVQAAQDVLGGKWKPGILFRLRNGACRLSQLKREMPWISEAVLIRQLKELVAAGVVSRTDFHEVPPRVEYELTAHGKTLEPVLSAIGEWGQVHLQRLQESQSRLSA